MQCAKKVVSDSPGLVDFAIGLVNSVFDLPVKPRVLTSLACRYPGRVLLKVTFFFLRMSSERWGEKRAYKIAAYIN